MLEISQEEYSRFRDETMTFLNVLAYKLGKDVDKILVEKGMDEFLEDRQLNTIKTFTEVRMAYLSLMKEGME